MDPAVVVVGSLNLDLVVPVPRHPAPGETVLGGDVFRNPGGKGANQAVVAARLGQSTALVGRVGTDDAGRALLSSLREAGVDAARVLGTDDAPTGMALITVDEHGENAIVVSPGANARLRPADVESADPILRAARVVLLQLEVPMETAVAAARSAAGTVVLNPAPAQPLPPALLDSVDVLVPNRSELAVVTGAGTEPRDDDHVVRLAARIEGPAVVVTLGADGALVVEGDRVERVPAVPVDVVDTTAAGDAFCGAMADALVRGSSLVEAGGWAARVAAVACTTRGAQASLPTRDEVLASSPAPAGPGDPPPTR